VGTPNLSLQTVRNIIQHHCDVSAILVQSTNVPIYLLTYNSDVLDEDSYAVTVGQQYKEIHT